MATQTNGLPLERWELEQLGLTIRDDYQVPLADEDQEGEQLISGILAALEEAQKNCGGPKQAWTRRNLKRAMVLIGGLNEKVVQEILRQEHL